MKITRYTAIWSPRSFIVHRTVEKLVAGSRTVCGRWINPGWQWTTSRLRKVERCKQCYR